MSADLIPCPFCGGPAAIVAAMHATGARRYYPQCCKDGCPGAPVLTTYATEAEAVAVWNTRPVLSDHHILLAVQRQVAGLVAEKAAQQAQIDALVTERDALRARITELEAAALCAPYEVSPHLNCDNPRLFVFVPGRSEPEDVSEIQARAEAATPGPWMVMNRGTVEDWDVTVPGPDINFLGAYRGMFAREADAQFMAHAREDVPLLIAAIKHLATEHQETVKTLIRADRTTEVFDAEVDRLEREKARLKEHNHRLTWALRAIDTRLHAERDGGLNLMAGGHWEQGRHYRYVTSRTLEQMCNVAVSATAERPAETEAEE